MVGALQRRYVQGFHFLPTVLCSIHGVSVSFPTSSHLQFHRVLTQLLMKPFLNRESHVCLQQMVAFMLSVSPRKVLLRPF